MIANHLERAAGLGAESETLTFDAREVRMLAKRLEETEANAFSLVETETAAPWGAAFRALAEALDGVTTSNRQFADIGGEPRLNGPATPGGRASDGLRESAGPAAEFARMIRRARRRAVRDILEPVRSLAPSERPNSGRPNPFADLPAWHWPLTSLGRGREAEQILERLLPTGGRTVDRTALLDLLAWSRSFTGETGHLLADLLPGLSQARMDELIDTLKDERTASLALWGNPESRRGLAGASLAGMADWAGLVLDDYDAGSVSALSAVLNDEAVLPHWQPWPEFWQALACWLLGRALGQESAFAALDRAVSLGAGPGEVARDLLVRLRSGALLPERLQAVEKKVQALAPDDTWANYHLARLWLSAAVPEREHAAELLIPLLAKPPGDWGQCLDLLRMVVEDLPNLAGQLGPTVNHVLGLTQNDVGEWSRLGWLLMGQSDRYEEAESAYRKAIELDPRSVDARIGLGYLYYTHLARYEDAELAVREAIEIDSGNSTPWILLGDLLLDVHGECRAAADAFERAAAGKNAYAASLARAGLACTRLRQSQTEAARQLAREALDSLMARRSFEALALVLAVNLAERASSDRLAERARAYWNRTGDPDTAAALLHHACCHPDREDPEAAWERLAGVLKSHAERYRALDRLHVLAGFRPEAREAARTFSRRLLDPAPELVARCKDVPAPAYMWERFRPFVEGRSGGAGDPADGFCTDAPERSG